jgi:hypothetical protein
MRLHGCITGGFSIEKNFKTDETGNVINKNKQQYKESIKPLVRMQTTLRFVSPRSFNVL